MSEEKSIVYVDIETLDFFQDEAIKALPREMQPLCMRFGLAVTWDKEGGERVWEQRDSAFLWDYLGNFEIVAGYNIKTFDLPIIYANALACQTMPGWFPMENVFDLFDIIKNVTGRWYRLEDLCQANLGRGKLADGQKAAEWLRAGDFEKAAEYCKNDVALERELIEMAMRGDKLSLPGLARKPGQESNMIFWLEGKTWVLQGYL
jgi:hypothetical protein